MSDDLGNKGGNKGAPPFGSGSQASPGAATASPPSVSIPSASALRKVACQIRHRLSDMELRSNVSWPASSPAAKTSGYVISEVADWQLRQWLGIVENVASAIEARSAETEGLRPQDESAVGDSQDAQGPTP